MDDILIIGRTFDEHLKNVSLIFDALFSAGLAVSWEKSVFLRSEVEYLGFVVGQGEIRALLNLLKPAIHQAAIYQS